MTPRASVIRSETIEYSFWLVFGRDGSLRMTRTNPGTDRNERAMACTAVLPKSLFATPTLKATISVSETESQEFNVDLQTVGDVLRQTIGVDIDLRIEEPTS